MKNEVNIIWVPGHQGIQGNEKADEAARKGSEVQFDGPEPRFGITYKSQRKIVRDYFLNKHNEMWCKLNTCKHTKELIAGTNNINTNMLLNKSR